MDYICSPGRLGAGGQSRKSSCLHNLATNFPVFKFFSQYYSDLLALLENSEIGFRWRHDHNQIWTSLLPLGRRLQAQQDHPCVFHLTQALLPIGAPWLFILLQPIQCNAVKTTVIIIVRNLLEISKLFHFAYSPCSPSWNPWSPRKATWREQQWWWCWWFWCWFWCWWWWLWRWFWFWRWQGTDHSIRGQLKILQLCENPPHLRVHVAHCMWSRWKLLIKLVLWKPEA